MDNIEIIKNNELFRSLNEEDLDTLGGSALSRSYPSDYMVFCEGDTASSMFIIKSGSVDITINNPDVNREMILATLEPGDHFGEISLFDGKPRSANVKTREPCECIILNQVVIGKLLQHNHNFATNVIVYLCLKIRFLTTIAQDLALLDVYRRLRNFLENNSEPTENGLRRTKIPLDQTEIAERLGCGREMINKILRELKTGQYIDYKARKDYILILKKLPPGR